MSCVVRLRGLPFSAKEEDIHTFFEGLPPAKVEISANASEAFVQFNTPEEAKKALEYNRKHIGTRYIEVYASTQEKYDQHADQCRAVSADGVLRVRGLPYQSTTSDLADFFASYQVTEQDVAISYHTGGIRREKPTGDGYVKFASQEIADQALAEKNGGSIGGRYAELFPSSLEHFQRAVSSRPGQIKTGAKLHCRGMPFQATVSDVVDFFQDFSVSAADVFMIMSPRDNRPSGECIVSFSSQEVADHAKETKNRANMGSRYVELSYASEYESRMMNNAAKGFDGFSGMMSGMMPMPGMMPGMMGMGMENVGMMGMGPAAYGSMKNSFPGANRSTPYGAPGSLAARAARMQGNNASGMW